jgi:apolipoprotein N-acyltransferase
MEGVETMQVKDYKAQVHKDHKSKVVRFYFLTYEYFWFHTQSLWIKNPLDRRPYTFIFRDWIYPHMVWFAVILCLWYAACFTLVAFHPLLASILLTLSSWLASHLIFGAPWVPGQQEDPQIEDC